MIVKIFIILIIAISILILLNYLAKISILGFKCRVEPQLGQKWVYKEEIKDPWFTPTNTSLVTIMDFKKNWIKFDRYYTKGETLPIDTFVRLYRYVKD